MRVPEGQHDRSLARSAWDSTPNAPSRRVWYDRAQLFPAAGYPHVGKWGESNGAKIRLFGWFFVDRVGSRRLRVVTRPDRPR